MKAKKWSWMQAHLNHLGHGIIFVLILTLFLFTRKLPLLATPGFESANFYGAILGPLLALVAATRVAKRNSDSFQWAITRETGWLIGHVAFLLLLLQVNSASVTSCSVGAGCSIFFMTMGPVLLLNLVMGSLAQAIGKIWQRIVLLLAVYGGYAAVIAALWWHAPQFRLLTHVSVIIASDLLEGATLTPALYAYRLSTLLFAFGLYLTGHYFLQGNKGSLYQRAAKSPIKQIALPIAVLALAFIVGQKSFDAIVVSRSALERDYSLSLNENGIIVRANPLYTTTEDARHILQEALFYRFKIQKEMGELKHEPLTIWLHQNDEEKFAYTGAKNVHFALPIHREVHISGSEIPHPVLGHELAHIFLGERTTTLFGVVGKYLVIPNLALTEGLAVLLSLPLNTHDGLTIFEQTQAMSQAHVSVDMDDLFSLNPTYFLKTNPHVSYLYAGTYLHFLLAKFDGEKRQHLITEIASRGTLRFLFTNPAEHAQSLAAFHAYLSEKVPDYALSRAEKFIAPSSILARDCQGITHSKDQWTIALLNGDMPQIKHLLTKSTATEALQLGQQAIKSQMSHGQFAHAKEIIDLVKHRSVKALAIDELAWYTMFRLERPEEALASLTTLDMRGMSLPEARKVLIVKTFLGNLSDAASSPVYAAGLQYLLDPAREKNCRAAQLQALFTASSPAATEPYLLVTYLLALRAFVNDDFSQAIGLAAPILAAQVPLDSSFIKETTRIVAESHLRLHNWSQAAQAFTELSHMDVTPAMGMEIHDGLERVDFFKTQTE